MEKRMLYRVEWLNGGANKDRRVLHVAVNSPAELFDNAVRGLAAMINSSAEEYKDLPRGWTLVGVERMGTVYL